MALTVQTVANSVAFRLGYRDASGDFVARVNPIEMCNAAGHFLAGARRWNWLVREPYGLNTTADQAYIILPDDFSELISVETDQSVGSYMNPATLSQVMALRSTNTTSSVGGYVFAVVYPVSPISGPSGAPRIELAPTPSTTVTNAFRLIYRASFKEVTKDSDHVIVPTFMEECYRQCAEAFAGAILQKAHGTLTQRLEALEPLFERVWAHDCVVQRSAGFLVNTAEEQVAIPRFWGPIQTGTVELA